jgi:hypothetical protein
MNFSNFWDLKKTNLEEEIDFMEFFEDEEEEEEEEGGEPATYAHKKYKLDPKVWGPHYWSVLHHMAWTYPENPNKITKRKYYDFIQNLPLFIPNEKIGDDFLKMMDAHPVTPYLDSRDSFIRWVHYIHNKINILLGKDELSFLESLENFKAEYKPKSVSITEKIHMNKQYFFIVLILVLLFSIYWFY